MKNSKLNITLAVLGLLFLNGTQKPLYANERPYKSKVIMEAVLKNQATGRPIPGAEVSITKFDYRGRKVGGPYRKTTDSRGRAIQEFSAHGDPQKVDGAARFEFYARGYEHVKPIVKKIDRRSFKAQGDYYVNRVTAYVEMIPEGGGRNSRSAPNNYHSPSHRNHRQSIDLRQYSGSGQLKGLSFTVAYDRTSRQEVQELVSMLERAGMRCRRVYQVPEGHRSRYRGGYIDGKHWPGQNASKWLVQNVPHLRGFREGRIDTRNKSSANAARVNNQEDVRIGLP